MFMGAELLRAVRQYKARHLRDLRRLLREARSPGQVWHYSACVERLWKMELSNPKLRQWVISERHGDIQRDRLGVLEVTLASIGARFTRVGRRP